MKTSLLTFLFLMTFSAMAFAQGTPMEITADNSLEWDQNAHTYKAVGNAVIKQNGDTLFASVVTAHYDPKDQNKLIKLIAEENVELRQADQSLKADKIIYTLDDGHMIATGTVVEVKTPQYTVTTNDRIEYWRNDDKAIAYGRPIATDGKMTVMGDTLTAVFANKTAKAQGAQSLQKLIAENNVEIKNKAEIITGDYGVYDMSTSLATITGNVEIHRGANRVSGTRAIMNTKTGVSQIFAGNGREENGKSGRVRALFYTD